MTASCQILGHHIATIDTFLTPVQCQEFIQFAENQGFAPADVDIGTSRSHLSHIRNNTRVDWHNPELAEQWWTQKLTNQSLPVFEGKHACGLSPHFRFYKYEPGQKFNMHKDGRQQVEGHQTLFTLLVYLNDGYQGGQTLFRQDNLAVSAETGKALIFEHHLWHQGVKLESGVKYVLRTDVVYKPEM